MSYCVVLLCDMAKYDITGAPRHSTSAEVY